MTHNINNIHNQENEITPLHWVGLGCVFLILGYLIWYDSRPIEELLGYDRINSLGEMM